MTAEQDPAEATRARRIFVGSNIRDARIARGLSQPQLAILVGVKRRSIYAWESGERWPGLRLPEIARALRTSRAELLGIEEEERPDLSGRIDALSEDLRELAESTDASLAELLAIVRLLASALGVELEDEERDAGQPALPGLREAEPDS